MDAVQKVQLRISESRQKLSGLLDTELDKRSETFEDDLKVQATALRSMESELQAALLIAPDPETRETRNDPETTTETAAEKELRELRGKLDFGRYVSAAMGGHGVIGGAEAEYGQHLGIPDSHFPMEMLTRGLEEDLEKRASRDGDANASQRRWVDRVFAEAAAMRLGVTFDTVPAGTAAYPITEAGASGVQRGRTQAVTEGTYTIAVTELKPTRNAVHGIYSIEDDARLPGLSDAILRDMRASLMDTIDKAIFVGDSGANENSADITGLQTATITEKTLTQANKVKGDKTLEAFVDLVDGVHATMVEDLRVVTSKGANSLWYSTIHNSAVDNQTVAQFLRASGLSWRVRGGIENDTANGDFGAFVGLPRGIRGAAVAAVWDSGQLVRDPYSSANKGEVQLTLNYLWALGLPRTANFKRLKFVA